MSSNIEEIFLKNYTASYRAADQLIYAYHVVSAFMPMSEEKLQTLSDSELLNLDGFTVRFSRLQDILSKRTFRSLIEVSLEDSRQMTMIDVLNKMEKYDVICSFDAWKEIRNARNSFVHEYTLSPSDIAQALTYSHEMVPDLIEVINQLRKKAIEFNLPVREYNDLSV